MECQLAIADRLDEVGCSPAHLRAWWSSRHLGCICFLQPDLCMLQLLLQACCCVR